MEEFPLGCFIGAEELLSEKIGCHDDSSGLSSSKRRRTSKIRNSKSKNYQNDNDNDNDEIDGGSNESVVCGAIYYDHNHLGFSTFDDDASTVSVSFEEIPKDKPKFTSHIKRAIILYVENVKPCFIVLSSSVDSFIHDICVSLYPSTKAVDSIVPEESIAVSSQQNFNVVI